MFSDGALRNDHVSPDRHRRPALRPPVIVLQHGA
jgi:hypothetical protein